MRIEYLSNILIFDILEVREPRELLKNKKEKIYL